MRILFITKDFSGASLCYRLRQERNEVRAFVADKSHRHVLDGLIEKIDDLEAGLIWVGKDGLIVCDDNGFGKIQDDLRYKGYSVVGGCEEGDKLEDDRLYCQRILSEHGMKTLPIAYFDNALEAVRFVEKNRGMWVIKQNGNPEKTFCYVGRLPDGSDVIDLLQHYEKIYNKNNIPLVLQKRAEGVEIAIARYFNGKDWIGPVEMNFEHKKLFPGDVGPKTYEMGNLMWYDANENSRLFQETLDLLKPYLQKLNYRGDFDLNCIDNEQGVFPLEATTRFGYPATQLQMEIHDSYWGNFLKAVADGNDYPLRWKEGYGIVVLIATPPFPYYHHDNNHHLSPRGLKIHFREPLTKDDSRHIHFEEVFMKRSKRDEEEYFISSDTGYVMHVSDMGKTVEEARENVYQRICNTVIPRMFYRTDIGIKFVERDKKMLEKWGYL